MGNTTSDAEVKVLALAHVHPVHPGMIDATSVKLGIFMQMVSNGVPPNLAGLHIFLLV